MTSANANVTVNTIVDKAFESAMSGMQRSMQQTITSINGFNRSQRAANASGGAISRTLNQISKEGRGLSSSFSRVKADMAGLDAAFRKNRAVIAQLESSIKQLEAANRKHGLSTKTGFDTAPLKAYKSQLESVNKMQKEITNTQKAMNFMELGKKFNKSAQALSYAGMRMTYGLSLPISIFLRTGFQSLKALDKEVIRTGKLIGDGFSKGAEGTNRFNEAMALLDQRLDKLSITWGVSRELVQGLAGDFAEIGISDPKALANLAQFTAEFEKLGNVDITQAQASIQAIYQQIARVRRDQGIAVTGTKAINQMVEEVRGAIAFFNFAENKTTLSLKDMADAFPEVSAAATSFGLNMQTTAALLAPMVGAGFQVGASANSIKVSLQRLVAPTKKNQDIIKALTNVIGKDFRLSTKIGAEGIQDLIDGYTKLQDKLGDAGALTFFAELFGVRQGPRMEVAIKQMSEYQQELDKAGSAERTLAKELELQVNKQLQLVAMRNRSVEGRKVEFVQLNKIKDIQDLIQQSQEKSASGQFTERALAIQKAQEAEVKRLKDNNSEIDKGNNLLGERFDRIKTESGKILSGAMFGTALTSETLEEELTRVQGSIQVRYGRARESIKSIARELTVVFGDLLNAINPILEKISTWIQLLPSGTKKLIGVVLILLAALGPVIRTLGAASQIAGTFAMTRGKGILKFRNDVISLNGTLVESSNLLTRLGGKFTKIGKDGTLFGTRKDLKRLEAAAPIQEKIDAGQKLSFAEKSIYKKSIKGLIGRREYLRVQAANASGQAGPLDQPVLPVGSANVSGFDIRSITTSQNLANPVKAIEDFTINLIQKMEEAVVKAANRASKNTKGNLNPRVGANSAAGGVITPFGVVKTATTSPATQTAASTATTSQQKPVSAQYYTKLMAILEAIQKCICSPGKVVTTSGGKPGGGQPASSNAPPAPKPTSKPAPQPTQPAGGGQSAPSPRNRPVTPSTPKPAEIKVGQVFKPTMGYGAIPFISAATETARAQKQVVNQVKQDVQQATDIATKTESKAKSTTNAVKSTSNKIQLTKQSFIQILNELGLKIPQNIKEGIDFAFDVQKKSIEKLKLALSGAEAQSRLDAFAAGSKGALGIRGGESSFIGKLFRALGQTTKRQKTADIKYEQEAFFGNVSSKGELPPREMTAVEGKMHVRIIQGLRKKLEYYSKLQENIDKQISQVIQNVMARMPNASEAAVNAAVRTATAKLKIQGEEYGNAIRVIKSQIRTAFEQITAPFVSATDEETGKVTKQLLRPYTESSKNKLLALLSGKRDKRSTIPMAQRGYVSGIEELSTLPKTPSVPTGPVKSPYDDVLPKLASSAQLSEVIIPEDKLTEKINQLIRKRKIEVLQQLGKIKDPKVLGSKTETIDKNIEKKVASLNEKQKAQYDRLINSAATAARPQAVKILKEQSVSAISKIGKQLARLEDEAIKKYKEIEKIFARHQKDDEELSKLNSTIEESKKILAELEAKTSHTAKDTRLKEKTIAKKDAATEAAASLTARMQERDSQIASLQKELTRIDELIKLGKAELTQAQENLKLVGQAPPSTPVKPASLGGYPMPAGATRPIPERRFVDFFVTKAPIIHPEDLLPKISGGAMGPGGDLYGNLLQQLQAVLKLPAQTFENLKTELASRAEKINSILKTPMQELKGDIDGLVNQIKQIVIASDQSVESVYDAILSKRNDIYRLVPKATTKKTAAPAPGDLKASQDAMVQKVIDSAISVKKVTNEFLTFVDRPLRKLAEKINQMAGEKLINTKAPVEERKVQIISALKKLGIAVENVINQDVKAVEETAQAVETTKPKVPRLPRAPKPAVDGLKQATEKVVTTATEVATAAIPTITPVWTKTRRGQAEEKLAAAMAGTAGATPIALGMNRVDQVKALIPPRPSKERYVPKAPTAREVAGIPITGRGVARVGAAVSTGGISEIAVLLKNILAKRIGTDAQQVRYMDPRMQYEIAKRQTTRERGIGPASSARQQRKAEIEARQIARDPNNPLAALTRLSNIVATIPSKFAMKFMPIRDNIQAIGNLYGPPILRAIDVAKTKTISIGKSIIKTAYQIEKEIIKSPVTSTIIMAKGLIAAGAQIQAVMPQVIATTKKVFEALGGLDFIQNTKVGQVFYKTANVLYLGAGGLVVAGANTGKFIYKAFTDPKEALNMAGRGLATAGKALANGAKEIAKTAGQIAAVPLKAAGRALSKPVFAVTQGLFGVGGQARTVEGPGGSTITKKGFFRRDVITNQDGTQSRGAGVIGKTMKGVSGAFKGAIGMGGQMASMLTYQLGPAGMLLMGPMNKVIGLMQRFSKVSAPILIIITAIALAIMVLKKTFENMGGKAQNIMDNFKAAFENIKAIFGVLVGVFKDFFASLFGNGAKDSEEGGENIRQVVGSISEKVLAFTEKLKAFFEKTLEPVIRKVLSGVSLVIKGIIGFIGPVIQFIKNLVGYFKGGGEESKKGMSKAFDGMKEAAKKVFIGLITIFKTPLIFLVNITFKALGLVTNIFERAVDVILIIISSLVRWNINLFFSIPKAILQIVEIIITIWTNLQKRIVDIVKESIKLVIRGLFTLPQGAISLVGKLVGIFAGLITGWGKILQKMAEMFVEFGKKIIVDLPKKIPVFGKVFDALGIDSIVSGAIDLLSKPLEAVGNIYENVGNTVDSIVKSATSTLNNGLSSAEGKALSFVDSVGNGIKDVLSYIREVSDAPRNAIADFQNMLLDGVMSAEQKSRAFIGGLSDFVVGLGDDIEGWLKGLGEAEKIAKGIGEEVGGESPAGAETPSQAEAAGKTIAEAINEGMKNLKQNFFDKVIDNLSKALNGFKDKFKEAIEKQKDEALKFFDDQIAAIDALAEAEERLTATKEYEENRRLKLSERALQRENYVKQRALAIYEGRIDDARLLNLQEEKDKRDFDKDLQKFDQDRTKTLQGQNREQAKAVIQQQKNALAEKFDKDIKSFEDFIEKVGQYGTLTQEQLEAQFKELQTAATTTSDNMRTAFQDYYGSLPGLIQQNTEPTVGFFGTSLNALITEATNKYGLAAGTKDPASLLGVTELMLNGMSDIYSNGFTNSVLPAYSAGTTALKKIGTDFADPNNFDSPKQTYSRAIAEANAAVVAEFNKMNTSASSAFAEVISGINAETKKLAIAAAIRQAKEELEKTPTTVAQAINKAMSTPSAARSTVDQATAGVLFGDIWSQPLNDGTGRTLGDLYNMKYYGGMVKRYNGGKIPSYAVGGVVPGFAQQGVPTLLHGGEYVINSKAVSGLGQMFLNYINEFKFGIPRYATPKISMPETRGQFKTEIIKTENETIHNYNFYVDNFIGEDQWFESMMKNYNVKVLPNKQKAAGLESRVVRTYNGINKGI